MQGKPKVIALLNEALKEQADAVLRGAQKGRQFPKVGQRTDCITICRRADLFRPMIFGSGGGTRTPDLRIMIPLL